MGYRVFKDSQGTEWQTWDVVPRLAERRTSDRRRDPSPIPPSPLLERRRVHDRRLVVGRRPPVLSGGLNGGWLCFEASAEKRRLTPIPGDWLRCGEEQLEEYCRLAKPARPATTLDITKLLDQVN